MVSCTMTDETVYVALLDEGLEVWRPVKARRVTRDTYEILEQEYDRNLETWAFEPGTVVECQRRVRDDRKVLIATKAVDRDDERAALSREAPVWEGNMRLSLVTCPVRLFSALPSEVGCLANAQGGSIVLDSFVNERSIDTFFLADPYYLTPSSDASDDTFFVLLEAMRCNGVAALSSISTHRGDRTIVLFAGGSTLHVHVLRSRYELFEEELFTTDLRKTSADADMIELAMQLISQKEKKFTPPKTSAESTRETALTEGLRSGKVVSLVDALRKSIQSEEAAGKRNGGRSSDTG